MKKYIGISGHRGSGKKTVAYLLGQTIQCLKDGKEPTDEIFKLWCDSIIDDENIIYDTSLDDVYFDSFGDGPKTFVQLLLGCPTEYLYKNYYKDHTIVNIKDFSYVIIDEIDDTVYHLKTAAQVHDEMSWERSNQKDIIPITKDIYMTLREFILYFGEQVMQRYFGANVWLKSLNNGMYDDTDEDGYKIFIDVKTVSEVNYIAKKNGIIINTSRPGHRKNGMSSVVCTDPDYSVVIGKTLYDLKDEIIKISKNIVEK